MLFKPFDFAVPLSLPWAILFLIRASWRLAGFASQDAARLADISKSALSLILTMTTFNDILGTTSSDSAEAIKQRYKLLSIRVHPDKGGSKALMHLVRSAYDHAAKGRGDVPVNMPAAANSGRNVETERELARLRKEKEELQALNALLKTQLAHAQKGAGSAATNAGADYARKIAQLEGELVLAKEEKNRVLRQKDAAVAEQHKMAGELRRALSENEVLETELARDNGFASPKAFRWLQRIWLPAMTMSALGAVLFMGATMVNWSFVSAWFDPAEAEPMPPPARVIYAAPESKTATLNQPAIPDNDESNRIAGPQPFLQLKETSGTWSLAAYTENDKPYISIRSPNGSYVVNDCSGDFTLYLNEPFKPLRVAANLIYMHQNQHFHVYKIPYGQGSSPESWLQSRKLEINNEFYTSDAFSTSLEALLQRCRNVTS